MPYHKTLVIPALTSSARTSSSASGSTLVDQYVELGLEVSVTAVSGTIPFLTIVLQVSHDNSLWADHPDGCMTFVTTGVKHKIYQPIGGKYIRLSYYVSGTSPSFTFEANVIARS